MMSFMFFATEINCCLRKNNRPSLASEEMELSSMAEAVQHHARLIKSGFAADDSYPLSKILTFSALHPSGDLNYARSIFNTLRQPNSYNTNIMIRAYAKNSNTAPDQALRFFVDLHQHHHFPPRPDNFTFPFLLHACGRLREEKQGRQVHGLACKLGFCGCDRFVQNSLVHMYGTCGQLDYAVKVFDRMVERDVITWTSIIDGAADGGRPSDALRLFERMREEKNAVPNDATLVSVLGACAELGALTVGRMVHRIAEETGLDNKVNVATGLVVMYAKCGCLDSAEEVFGGITEKDAFAWTAMISGLAAHGKCREAVDMFHLMIDVEKVVPDERTFIAVLSACRNAGWVAEGYRYFNLMKKRVRGGPKLQHYGCMVDLLAKVGRLDEAETFVKGMPMEPDAIIWRTLIWASKVHGDIERVEKLVHCHHGLHETDSFILPVNVCSPLGKWDEEMEVRKLLTKENIMNQPGGSKIEVNGTVHEFKAADSDHPEAERIYAKWDEIAERLRLEGYVPNTKEILLDTEDQENDVQLHHHSEKLAMAFGLISTDPGDRILVVNNLRSCEDCHEVMKLVSKIYGREIVVRDRVRFHYFRNGVCSCGDLW